MLLNHGNIGGNGEGMLNHGGCGTVGRIGRKARRASPFSDPFRLCRCFRGSTPALLFVILLSLFPIPDSFAAIPMQINHQGVIKVSGTPFNGNGDFRFALVDPDTGQNRWTNDGSKVGQTGTPNAAVNLPIINGIYNVRLGDQALANMVSIPSTVFNDDNIVLRIWFSDGVNGIQQLAPDQPITSSPYAFHALTAENATSAITATSALTATNATSANSAVTATTASTALDTSAKISTHNSSTTAHSNIQLDAMRITSGKIDNARLNTGSGNGLDADSVDGFHSTSLLLTGEVRMWAGPISAIPSGWLICDGSGVSRTAYSSLFAVVGTAYGVGDGNTTFNLPDLRGKVAVGLDVSQSEFNVIGKTGGEKAHTLTIAEMPSHSHSGAVDGGFSANSPGGLQGGSTQSTGETGGGQAHNNLPPYLAIVFIIKT